MKYTNEIQNAIDTMNTALTIEEVQKAYHQIVKKCHPDQITAKANHDLFTRLTMTRDINLAKLSDRLEAWKRKNEQNEKPLAIRHDFKSLDELLNSGKELEPVIEGTVKRVCRSFSGKAPKANKKQITDKHHADAYGNFDGIRTYPWSTIILNKNYTINKDMMETVIQESVVQLLKNRTNEGINGLPVSVQVWIACRQAMNNIYYQEVKKPSYLQIERKHDLFDLEAYHTVPTEFWTTESTATTRVYMEELTRSPFERKVLALLEMGYNERDIAKAYGVNERNIGRVRERIYNRLLCDRMTAHLDSLEEIRQKNGQNRNASEKAMLKALIMRSIRNGMTYRRIAYHLHIAEYQDYKGITHTINDQITALLTA